MRGSIAFLAHDLIDLKRRQNFCDDDFKSGVIIGKWTLNLTIVYYIIRNQRNYATEKNDLNII